MSGPTSSESINPDELLRRVRAVAEERLREGAHEPPPQTLFPPGHLEPWEPFPWRREAGSRAAPAEFVSVLDFVDLEPARFVRYCFQALLGRDPTEREAVRWTARVRRGWPRVIPVLSIRWSGEGRAAGVRLDGVWARIRLDLEHLLRSRLSRAGRRS
jgi:hypothetical protein